ncbi:MAG TPA: transcription-repair coupling factor [Bacteroidia bacterium]|nr:transcription-repair coupling factor [Bacteroidia bacterium]
MANYFSRFERSCLLIASNKEKAAYLLNDLEALLPEGKTLFFPESYRQPYQPEKTSNANIQERAEVLNRLAAGPFKGVLVTYPQALCEKVSAKKQLHQNTLLIRKDEKLSIEFVEEFLRTYHFEQVDFVFEPGQYSVRGGIVDIYSFAGELPFRVELYGNKVEAIKSFDPLTQLSSARFDFVTLLPNINAPVFNENKILITDYFDPQNSTLFHEDMQYCLDLCTKKFEQAEKAYLSYTGEIAQLGPEMLFALPEEMKAAFLQFPAVEAGNQASRHTDVLVFHQKPQAGFNKNFDLLIAHLKENRTKGYRNYFLTDNVKQSERLISIFNDILAREGRTYDSLIEHLPISLHEGFTDDELKLALFTDHQIFERYHRFKLRELRFKSQEALSLKELLNLQPGDYVTHIDHGIGRYAGLQKLSINGRDQESVKLLFRDNDVLYVSIHSLHRISKYSGKEGQVPRIDKLGSSTWNTLKQKTKRKVKELAYDLIRLYAERRSKPGHAYPKDNYLQHELEASFIFEDTPDQIKVTRDVKRDMEKPHPMDRLVCGDVGFGKTEIAVRAAFKAVCDSKQVAILVPTTLLAYQHFKTFRERLKDLPCTVEYINRFKSARQQNQILKDLEQGKIDILIGTHKLVGKSIKFRDLGLLIIDEEQKFGVGVKDKLKTMKSNVDSLTLTATPIPRTLQFSLMGARDLSVINTPPPNRYPVQTELHHFDEELIRDAIRFELNRGGQVFFVHNKVQNIAEVAGIIQRLVPDARLAIGHGQMEGHRLEDVMLGFVEGDYDVLVSTTIIESGIDISNANTIFINDAHQFGLSDLHQMRGRVGRSNKKAFCYLLAPSSILLSAEARKRLKAIVEFSDLGSGFQIAMRDLDIRGAGNLLGGEQSGFINDMGFDTYMKILNEAVEELKEEDWYKESVQDQRHEDKSAFSRQFVKETLVETDLQLLIPENYVSNLNERLLLYRELDNLTKEEELLQFQEGLRDRFGPLPEEVSELVNVVRMRRLAMQLGFEKLSLRNSRMIAYFLSKQQSDYFNSPVFKAVLQFAQSYPVLCQLKEQGNKFYITINDVNAVNRAIEILREMQKFVPAENTEA